MLTALVTYAAEEGAAHNPLIPAWYDIIWSSVCFIVILVLFWLYALPRMKKLLDERSAAIEGNIAKADELLNLLDPFVSFPPDITPSTSLLREFIGEGAFDCH